MRASGATFALACALAGLACSEARDRTLAACEEAALPIAAGYGARGPHDVRLLTLDSPSIPGEEVSIHLPKDAAEPVPVVLFAHAYATPEREQYRAFLEHIASRGFAVIFVPYMVDDPRHGPRYEALWDGFSAAVREHAERLDPGRLGIVGHSYGAGAAPWLALRALREEGWGERALFLHLLAPFYPLQITREELASFPEHAKVLVEVFEDDNATDHRIAIGLYADLGIPEKDYLLVLSDQRGRCRLPAIHSVPQSKGFGARDDAVDEWALYRLFDALAAYAFEGEEAGRRVALGRGAPEQIRMGSWEDGRSRKTLVWKETPEPAHAEASYIFKVSHRDAWAKYGEPMPDAAPPVP